MRSAATWGVASVISTFLLAAMLAPAALCQTPAAGAPAPPANTGSAPGGQATPGQTAPGQSDSAQPNSPDELPTAQAPSSDDQGSMFVFKKQVEEVVLHATVVDEQGHLITGLDKSAFSVTQNGTPEPITSFRREDVPVEIGIVVDNSGSMRDKRQQVNDAVLNLIRASNSQDQVFVVNFGQNPYLDQDFTSDVNLLQAALHQVSAKGSTALYDAIVASAAHLENNSLLSKKVLLVITDGQDNMSQETLQEASRKLQQANGPTLYAIGLLGSGLRGEGREALQHLASSTGGVAYFPDSLDQVDNITRTVAHDIRSQYILAYKPRNQNVKPQYQTLQVQAHAPGYGKLTVRTRSGYYPPEGNH
ncbi:MAG: VWA domain-containing protein [Candidatus Sulfotelmatobacter sp.]|jgi:Ca-activated chloride channel family protein